MILLVLFLSVILNLRNIENIIVSDIQKWRRELTAGTPFKDFFFFFFKLRVKYIKKSRVSQTTKAIVFLSA